MRSRGEASHATDASASVTAALVAQLPESWRAAATPSGTKDMTQPTIQSQKLLPANQWPTAVAQHQHPNRVTAANGGSSVSDASAIRTPAAAKGRNSNHLAASGRGVTRRKRNASHRPLSKEDMVPVAQVEQSTSAMKTRAEAENGECRAAIARAAKAVADHIP